MKKTVLLIFIHFIVVFGITSHIFGFEHPRYEIDAKVDALNRKIEATQTVTFTNNTQNPTGEIYFHIYPNRRYTQKEIEFLQQFGGYFKVNPYPEGFESSQFQVNSVRHADSVLSYAIEGDDQTILKIQLSQPLASGQTTNITIQFQLNIPHAYGRFGWHRNIIAMSRWYPILSVYDENGWHNYPFYPYHRPFFSESAQYNVSLTVADEQVVIHSGILKETIPSDAAGMKNLKIETDQPVREFTLSMSPDYQVVEKQIGNHLVKSFYLPGRDFYGRQALNMAVDLMTYYGQLFGEYPYKEFSIAPVYLGYGGEQMSNMIFMDTRVYRLPKFLVRYFDFLISHETGHQWFYNTVGINENSQIWLEEGVNSYFILNHLEHKYGDNAFVMDMPKELQWMVPNFSFRATQDFRYKSMARNGYDHPIVSDLSSFIEPSSIFSLAYGKGSQVVTMLRYLLGPEAFDKVFARIFKDYQFRNLNIDDLVRLSEEESGKDLSWFFDQWLYTDKSLDYAVNAVKGRSISLERRGDITMPVEVMVHYDDGSKEVLISDGISKMETLTARGLRPIQSVTIDPRQELLDIDRSNNKWPRLVNVYPVPWYLGLYDFDFLLPEDSFNVVVGPEVYASALGLKMSLQKPFDWNFYMGTGYELGEQLHKSRVGFLLRNVFQTDATAGFEISNVNDFDTDEEDLVSGKIFLRRELWPVLYGLGNINDHITLYLIRNRSLKSGFLSGGREDTRNISYLRKDEAIVGTTLHLGRAGPYLDPSHGYSLDVIAENSGHFLGATQYFYRGAVDLSLYKPVTTKSKMALRLKYGGGYPDDKNLFQLGGKDGLRGYDRKTVRGSSTALASVEYRFPIREDLDFHFLDNIIGIESLSGVVFVDAGQSWFSSFDDSDFKRDAGVGLRMTMNLGSFLEKVMVRMDVAQAINDDDEEDPRFWFGINQAF